LFTFAKFLSSLERTFDSNYTFLSKIFSCLVKDKIGSAHCLAASAGNCLVRLIKFTNWAARLYRVLFSIFAVFTLTRYIKVE
jgi:hypothetical protein